MTCFVNSPFWGLILLKAFLLLLLLLLHFLLITSSSPFFVSLTTALQFFLFFFFIEGKELAHEAGRGFSWSRRQKDPPHSCSHFLYFHNNPLSLSLARTYTREWGQCGNFWQPLCMCQNWTSDGRCTRAPLPRPSKFFSAFQSYCPRLSVGWLSYNSRSSLIRLDRRIIIGRAALPIRSMRCPSRFFQNPPVVLLSFIGRLALVQQQIKSIPTGSQKKNLAGK